MIKSRHGMTIVEIAVSAFILALLVIGIGKVLSQSAAQSVKAGHKASAADILAKFMEEVKHRPMREYEKISGLSDGNEIQLPESFYSDTKATLNELGKNGDKDFWIDPKSVKVKAEVNKYKQIVELGITCQVDWMEKGSKEAGIRPQSLRDYAVIYNSDLMAD